ncbi:MAG: S26 family signal peptidase [Myxococcota bacterium]
MNTRYTIVGDSMWPAIPDGAEVVATDDPGAIAAIAVGDVVVAKHPFRKDMVLIKRVAELIDGRYVLHGDAPHGSEDSRALGPFRPDAIVGVVIETQAD